MFSPMSVGAYIYNSLVGPTEGEDGDGDDKREDLDERDDGSGDSDGGTSIDPPGMRDYLKRTPRGKEANVPPVEAEIITTDVVSDEYSARKDEFAAKLAALPEAPNAPDDDQMTTVDTVGDDRGGASKDLHASTITSPASVHSTGDPMDQPEPDPEDAGNCRSTDYALLDLDPREDGNLQSNGDFGDCALHQDQIADELDEHEQDGSSPDSNSDSYSFTTSDETASTVRENTESGQLETEDRNGLEAHEFRDENNVSWPSQEEHLYITPDLEFPFYKSTVDVEKSVNLAELLENMDKKIEVKPPKLEEGKYSPRPVSDEELDNALKILRSGKPPTARSWYSLDNISSSKPNRAYALYYSNVDGKWERRNSSGDENELGSPLGNGIVYGLTGKPWQEKPEPSYYSDGQWEDDNLNTPNAPVDDYGAALIPEPALTGAADNLRPDGPLTTSASLEEHAEFPKPECYPEEKPLVSGHWGGDIHDPQNAEYHPDTTNEEYHPDTNTVDMPPDQSSNSPLASSVKSPTDLGEDSALPNREAVPETLTFVCPPSPETRPELSPPPPVEPHSPLSPDTVTRLNEEWPRPPTPEPKAKPAIGPKPNVPKDYPNLEKNPDAPAIKEDFSPQNQDECVAKDTDSLLDSKNSPISPDTVTRLNEQWPLPPTPEPKPKPVIGPKPNVPKDYPNLEKNPNAPVNREDCFPQNQVEDVAKDTDSLSDSKNSPVSPDTVTRLNEQWPLPPTPEPKPKPVIGPKPNVPKDYPNLEKNPNAPVNREDCFPQNQVEDVAKDTDSLSDSKNSPVSPDTVTRLNEEWPLPPTPEPKAKPAIGPKPNVPKDYPNLENNPGAPANREDCFPQNQVEDVANDTDSLLDSKNSPVSPEPYIAASVRHTTVFHLPSLEAFPEYFDVESQVFPKKKAMEDLQHPVFSMRQKESALVELEDILPEKKAHPPLPPKPKHLKKLLDESPMTSSSVDQDESQIDLSALDTKQPVNDHQDDSPMSSEPYISASVKHRSVFFMPPLGSPESVKVPISYRGKVIEDEQFPVFSKVHKELALTDLENVVPQRKRPPKVPPKPSFSRKHVEEPSLVSVGVNPIECPVDFSILDNSETSKDTLPEPELVPKERIQDAEKETHKEGDMSIGDDVVIIQAGISVYREQPEEIFPVVYREKPVYMRSESLQISDTGNMTYIPRDNQTAPLDENAPSEDPEDGMKNQPVKRSTSREMVSMTARLSLHRLESGEQFTETVFSVHEQEIEEEGTQTASSSESEDVPVFRGTNHDTNEDTEIGLPIGEENGTLDEETHLPTDPYLDAPESFPEDAVPVDISYDDHRESSEFSSSADEFMTEADLTISKMEAALNSNNLKDISSSSSSSSSDDSSCSSDSDDSSFESAEEHTYIVTELADGDDFQSDYLDEGRDMGLRSSLPQVIEEGDEDEYEESSGDDRIDKDGNVDVDEEKKQEKMTEIADKTPDEEKTNDDDDDRRGNYTGRMEDEVPFDQEIAKSVEAVQESELPDTRIPQVIPVEVDRFPKYINYDKPTSYHKQPADDNYETWRGTDDVLKGITESESSPPQSKSPETYPAVVTESISSDAAKESVTSEELPDHVPYDMDQHVSDGREYCEETMDFSSEYSDEPEWQSPPPSTGARIFVLTANMANMRYPVKVEPRQHLANPVHLHPERESPGEQHQDKEQRGQEETIPEDDRKDTDDDVHYSKPEDEPEPTKYFRPIAESAVTESETSIQEQARPIPHYGNEYRYDSPNPESSESTPEDSREPEGQENNRQDVRTVTLTYTVIHTRPTSLQIDENAGDKENECEDRRNHKGDYESQPPDEKGAEHFKPQNADFENLSPPSDSNSNAEDEGINDYNSKLYDPSTPYEKDPSPDEYGEQEPQNDKLIEHTPPELHGDLGGQSNKTYLSTGVPYQLDDSSNEYLDDEYIPAHYAISLDKNQSMDEKPLGESITKQSSSYSHEAPEHGDERIYEGSASSESQPVHETDVVKNGSPSSKLIPVNEVGPYNYASNPEHPAENTPCSPGTVVSTIELRPEVSLYTISSREQKSPEKKPTSPDAAAASVESEDPGPYKFSSWYEETSDDVPAMAIALVKHDIKLPSEYLPEREPVKKPETKPKPKEVTVINNSDVRSPEKLEQGPYRYTSWYEEPAEEKPDDAEDVMVISSVAPEQESSPQKDTPLSPDVEPGTYKYSTWYEEPTEEAPSGDFFVLSVPTAVDEKSNSDSLKTPVSSVRGSGSQRYSPWYDDPPEDKPAKEDYFVISGPITSGMKSNADSSKKTKDSGEKQAEIRNLSRSALYEDIRPTTEDTSETFVISRPYKETQLQPSDDISTGSTKAISDDLYYPTETVAGRHLSVEGSVSDRSRINSNESSRTSGSLADVSATSGEALRRTWSDESDSEKNYEKDFAKITPAFPPQPKPRQTVPSVPSSSDDELQRQPRRPGRTEVKPRETTTGAGKVLTPKAEYALASSSWRQIPVDEPAHPTRESVVWDSGDDKRKVRPQDRGSYDNSYTVPDKSRREIENMLDSLVPDDDAFEMPYDDGRDFGAHDPPQRRNETNVTSQWRNDSARSANVLPQIQTRRNDFVETSFQETRFQSTSVPHIPRGFEDNVPKGKRPDFAEPILALQPRDMEMSKVPGARHADKRLFDRQPAVREESQDGPPASRNEYRLAAASWEDMSSASADESSKRTKMETWDNDPGGIVTQPPYPGAVIVQQRHQAERAPNPSEGAYAPPRGRGIHETIVTADIHASYAQKPIPSDPELAVKMLSASASNAELAPPPPRDLGKPRKAHSTIGLSQRPPVRPGQQTIIPDAEADVPKRHHRHQVKTSRPPSFEPKPGRPHSPASITSYDSTQSLPARILPRLPRDNELERLKQHIATIGKQLEIKSAELRKIHTKNPSIRHHIPRRGPRGELISADGRILSTPEAPNKAELDKYKRFFDKLPEPHFRRLMHEMLEYKHMVKQKEEELRRLNTQCIGLRRRLHLLSQQEG